MSSNCSVLFDSQVIQGLSEGELQKKLESKDENVKIDGLKQIIMSTLNGQKFPKLMMTIIKYCLHTQNHFVKKLLLVYWEVVEKKNADGVLLHEMILVCNAMKNNLEHPNEYIRGATLRFLCQLKEAEVLESLIPCITANLEHRHSYVRKNAVLAVFTVYTTFPDLIPDAPELVDNFIQAESNPAAKRNAFLMLINCDQERAINFLASVINNITNTSEGFQLLCLELVRKVCREQPHAKSQFINCIFTLVNSTSNAVCFEGANTLCALSSAPTAIRAAVSAYCSLLQRESDNNIKLIILNRLSNLRRRNERILQELLMDVLRTLSSPDLEIRKATINLALELISPRNVEDVVGLFKKEISKTQLGGAKDEGYRKVLVEAMHKCAVRFPEVVGNVVHLLMNFLGDEKASSALDVIYFVREIVEEYEHLRPTILTKLVESFSDIRSGEVVRVALWILGEYARNEELDTTISMLFEEVGALPLYTPPGKEEVKEEAETKTQGGGSGGGPLYNADGSYATQSAAVSSVLTSAPTPVQVGSNLRGLLLNGDWFVATALASSLTKLMLSFGAVNGFDSTQTREQSAKMMLVLVSVMRLGTAPKAPKQLDSDSLQRIMVCIRVLMDPTNMGTGFADKSRDAFSAMLQLNRAAQPKAKEAKVEVKTQVDSLINLRQLKGGADDDDYFDEDDLSKALGGKATQDTSMNRVFQLTGFADPVYVEAQLNVLNYDINMEILIVNQTADILQNVSLELSTNGDLKLVEKPERFNLKPHGVHKVSANVKVTSTESGVIFGNVVYDSASGTNQTVVVLNNVNMDIMDYIEPATCTDTKFRTMWAEFEWENKVAVNTDIESVSDYLHHVADITNMRCMTPESTLVGSCQFLAANLYARSIFGEDALLNLSVERQDSGKVGGFIRIRSKTQGIALSLGDKITASQRQKKKS